MRTFSFFVSVLIAACGSSPVPESALVRIDEAARLFEKGRLDDAEASFRLAIELHPHVPAAHAGLGLVALARGHLEEAEVHLRAAVEIDEDFAIAWSNRGVVAERRGDLASAQAYYEQALSILPLFPDPRRNLVLLLLHLEQASAARAHAMRLVQISDDRARDIALLALCEMALGRPNEARARLETIRPEDGTHEYVTTVRGLISEAEDETAVAEVSGAARANRRAPRPRASR